MKKLALILALALPVLARPQANKESDTAKQEASQAAKDVSNSAQHAAKSAEAKAKDVQKSATGTATDARLFSGKDDFRMKGKVQGVGKSTLTVSRQDLPAAKLHVAEQTKIEIDGKQAKLGQIKQGDDVQAAFNLQGDRATAVEIKADSNKQ